jgi:threonine dehydratase
MLDGLRSIIARDLRLSLRRRGDVLNHLVFFVIVVTYALSLEKRKIVESPVTTVLADGLACRRGNDEALRMMLENVDHIVCVSDSEVAAAMRTMFTDTHNATEGAGAAGLAAAMKEAGKLKGKRVAVIATGSNVDHDVFAQVLGEISARK